ncbi:MAG: D-alanyl-D-alanine carboxypeptidase/D-alanyl-D-alanine-endopeptidase [Pseudanabaenaceae cyanobacterium bins.39]|nr:D-alanyl-D-alanine carboxypeptidase/D-alanyl-D-alanine-endopeptidase [Pseudanabaenaceae cyanobacterium bins.39]
MRHLVILTIAVLSFSNAALAAYANPQKICVKELPKEIAKIVESPRYQRSRIGIFVQTKQPKPQVLVNLDGDRLFITASNTKLFTTAIAMQLLGKDYRFVTTFNSSSLPNDQGVLQNGLWVSVSGDPSFSSDNLQSLVKQLKDKGIKRIEQGIWTTTSRQGAELSGSWEWQDLQEYYAASASPFTINGNALDWTISSTKVGEAVKFSWDNPRLARGWTVENQAITTASENEYTLQVTRPYGQRKLIITGYMPVSASPELGSVAIPHPESNFLKLLRDELAKQNIEFVENSATKSYRPSFPQDNYILASFESEPLWKLLIATNKYSNNLYAELLLRAMGDRHRMLKTLNAHRTKELNSDSLNSGLEAEKIFLQSHDIAEDMVFLADGSGLSRLNMATPQAIVQLLQIFAGDTFFRQSLPIGGVDGTLQRRFQNLNGSGGVLQAKTGTLTGAMALSGYASSPDYPEVIFSIIVNNNHVPKQSVQKDIDDIASMFTKLRECS